MSYKVYNRHLCAPLDFEHKVIEELWTMFTAPCVSRSQESYVRVSTESMVHASRYESRSNRNKTKQGTTPFKVTKKRLQRSGTIGDFPCHQFGRTMVLADHIDWDLARACLVIVFNEPVDRLLESLFEWRKLELFVVLARLSHEPE